jgi:hypothetical protein
VKACLAWIVILLSSCSVTRKLETDAALQVTELKLLSVQEAPFNLPVKGTTMGGLSSIDYDPANDVYYLICDDRSAINPARFYTAKLFIRDNNIDSIAFINVTTLRRPDGSVYPNSKQDPAHTPDPEGLRYNPHTKQLVWTSEGERIVRGKDTILEDPSIITVSKDGKYIDSFPIPSNLRMHATEKGPRQNGVLEGISFADNYRTLYVNVEEPLYEDGPRADLVLNSAWIRLFKFDVASKQNTAQYAYILDPIAFPAVPATAFKINGVPDILAAGKDQLIILERSFSTGRLACTIKIFLADLGDAENIIDNPSLKTNPPTRSVRKKLLLNMDALGIYVDNVEGICFGPVLPNGHQTLVLVADNNFAELEKTQFFLFEIIP